MLDARRAEAQRQRPAAPRTRRHEAIMPISPYLAQLRELIGPRLVLMPGVTAIIRDDQGRVLLQQRRDDGRWGLPGGQMEPGEAPAQALVREVWEETGLVVRPGRVLGVFGGNEGFRVTYRNGDRVEYVITTFECRVVGGTLGPRDDESLQLRWFAPAETQGLVAPEVHRLAAQPHETPAIYHWDDAWLEQLRTSEK
jgi:8-oxo-dGTP pyrophosphatase MutT (NUDIX family)